MKTKYYSFFMLFFWIQSCQSHNNSTLNMKEEEFANQKLNDAGSSDSSEDESPYSEWSIKLASTLMISGSTIGCMLGESVYNDDFTKKTAISGLCSLAGGLLGGGSLYYIKNNIYNFRNLLSSTNIATIGICFGSWTGAYLGGNVGSLVGSIAGAGLGRGIYEILKCDHDAKEKIIKEAEDWQKKNKRLESNLNKINQDQDRRMVWYQNHIEEQTAKIREEQKKGF